MKYSKFKSPNALNQDTRLSYSARRLGNVFYSFSNALGQCRKSYEDLAKLARCSVKTAVKGVQQLVEAGYISYCNTYHYAHECGRVVYGKNTYSVNLGLLQEGYTLISRDVFRYDLTDAFFSLMMAVFTCLGNKKRAWPSISMLQKMTGAARSTVCAGLAVLKELPILLVQHCMKKTREFAANSYILVQAGQTITISVPNANNEKLPLDLPIDHIINATPCKASGVLFSKIRGMASSLFLGVVRFVQDIVRT